jgi:uncharacterized protein YwqG
LARFPTDAEAIAARGCPRHGPETSQQWLLLLQIDLRDYLQQRLVEGTAYFLIRRDDLAARAFDKVVAVNQQT